MEDRKFKKVDSPEQLNQYIRLSNPGVWVILLSIAVLLVGVCIWGCFGKIDTKVNAVLISDNYNSYIYVKESDIEKIKEEMQVEIKSSDNNYKIIEIEESPEKVTNDMDEYARHLGNFQIGEWVYKCRIDGRVKEGAYGVDVIVESIAPMTFVFN